MTRRAQFTLRVGDHQKGGSMPYQDLGIGSTAPPKLSWAGLFGPAPTVGSGTKYSYGDDNLNSPANGFGLFPGGFDLGTAFNPASASGGGNSSSDGNVSTVLKDGKSDFLNLFSEMSARALGTMGAKVEPTQAAYPGAGAPTYRSGGLETSTILLIGAVGVGIYLYTQN